MAIFFQPSHRFSNEPTKQRHEFTNQSLWEMSKSKMILLKVVLLIKLLWILISIWECPFFVGSLENYGDSLEKTNTQGRSVIKTSLSVECAVF